MSHRGVRENILVQEDTQGAWEGAHRRASLLLVSPSRLVQLHGAGQNMFKVWEQHCSLILFENVVRYVRAPLLNIHPSRSISVSMTSCVPIIASMRVAGTPSARYAIINRIDCLESEIHLSDLILQATSTTKYYSYRSATWFVMSVFTRARNPTTASCVQSNSRLGQTSNSTCKCTAVRYLPLFT